LPSNAASTRRTAFHRPHATQKTWFVPTLPKVYHTYAAMFTLRHANWPGPVDR
jgi:hypothetical protein